MVPSKLMILRFYLGRQYCKTCSRLGNNKNNKQKVYMRQFSGSKVSCIKDYVKPSICENNPDHIIFRVGVKDIPSGENPQVFAIDLLLANYKIFFLMGDFSVESYNGFLKEFCHLYNLKNLIKFLPVLKSTINIF